MIVSGFSGIRLAGRNATLALMITTALSACTSVEYAEKPEIETPKIASVPTVAPTTAEGAAATLPGQPAATASSTTTATQVATTTPQAPATNGQAAFVQPQAATAASAAVTQQAAPAIAPVPGVTPASAPVATAQQVALASVPRSTEQPTVIPVKADPPWVKAGRVHSASAATTPAPATTAANSSAQMFPEMPLPYEVTEMRSVIPLPKPGGTMLAYAGGPSNSAFSAIDASAGTSASTSLLYPSSAASKPELVGLIDKYATLYGVPKDLVHRVVHRESRYNPGAYSKGNFGLMQIRHATARSLGFQGPASGLLDAETNLKYAVKYLKGAWTVAGKDKDAAVRLYAKGYYYEAKSKGLLHVMQ